jgi:hypothetical protein
MHPDPLGGLTSNDQAPARPAGFFQYFWCPGRLDGALSYIRRILRLLNRPPAGEVLWHSPERVRAAGPKYRLPASGIRAHIRFLVAR